MTLPSKYKKFLAGFLLAVVVLLAVGAYLLFFRQSSSPTATFLDLSDYNSTAGTTLLLNNPDAEEEAPVPLSRCTITAPEGWEQLTDSAQTANRYSQGYADLFYQDGWLMQFSQSYAADQTQVTFSTRNYETIRFGDWDVIYYTTESGSEAVWTAENYLLKLSCSGEMSREDLLEWVAAVNLQDPQLPETSPLVFVPGYSVSVENTEWALRAYSTWTLGGNPEQTEWEEEFVFAQIPDGFSLMEETSTEYLHSWEYQTSDGETLTLENNKLAPYGNFLGFGISIGYYDADSNRYVYNDYVQQVTVQGQEGLLYWYEGSSFSALVWLEGDYYVRLTYEGSITPEEMLALGESAVVQSVAE